MAAQPCSDTVAPDPSSGYGVRHQTPDELPETSTSTSTSMLVSESTSSAHEASMPSSSMTNTTTTPTVAYMYLLQNQVISDKISLSKVMGDFVARVKHEKFEVDEHNKKIFYVHVQVFAAELWCKVLEPVFEGVCLRPIEIVKLIKKLCSPTERTVVFEVCKSHLERSSRIIQSAFQSNVEFDDQHDDCMSEWGGSSTSSIEYRATDS